MVLASWRNYDSLKLPNSTQKSKSEACLHLVISGYPERVVHKPYTQNHIELLKNTLTPHTLHSTHAGILIQEVWGQAWAYVVYPHVA